MGAHGTRDGEMKLPRALLISFAITVAATVLLSWVFGGRAFALFLLLPFGFIFRGKSEAKTSRPDSKPIEPN
jgi:hypothetical protein